MVLLPIKNNLEYSHKETSWKAFWKITCLSLQWCHDLKGQSSWEIQKAGVLLPPFISLQRTKAGYTEFTSSLTYWKVNFSEQPWTQYPLRGGRLQGQMRSKPLCTWGRPNSTWQQEIDKFAGLLCVLTRECEVSGDCIVGLAWILLNIFLTPHPRVHTK